RDAEIATVTMKEMVETQLSSQEGLSPAAAEGVATLGPPGAARFQVTATSFLALFAVVGLALYGLPFYYDFMVRDFGWSRTEVTSGNAISKLVVGPLFGFLAGWMVDRVGPRRVMMAGIVMAGRAARRPPAPPRASVFSPFFSCQ